MIGRTLLIFGLIAAVVFTSVGYVNMLETRDAAEQAKYEENVKKAQDRAYNQLVKDAQKAEKNGEVPPEIPEDASMIEVDVKPVEYDLTNYMSDFITRYILAAALSIAAGVGLCWFFCHVKEMLANLKKAGPRRVIAGAIFWCGALAAAIIAAFGVVEIMNITKSTMGEVSDILMKEYIVWAIVALGCGIVLRWVILRLGTTTENTFRHVGMKLMKIGKAMFMIAVVIALFGLVAAVALGVLYGWATAAIGAVAALAVLAAGCICGLAINALGTCTMIMEPQAKEAQLREDKRRNAKEWVCPDCGKVQPIHAAACECGAVKPVHYHN